MIDAMLFLSSLDDCIDPMVCLNQQPIQQQPLMPECLDLRMLLGHEQFLGHIQPDSKQPENNPVLPPQLPISNIMSPTGPCGLCSLPIVDKNFLLIGDRSLHAHCARCASCGEMLENHQTCYLKNDSLFCKRDYIAKFWKRCERCCEPVEPGFFVIVSKDGYYHSECFSCIICGLVLRQGDTYMMIEKNSIFCQTHYELYLRNQQQSLSINMLSVPPTNEPIEQPLHSSNKTPKVRSKTHKSAKFSNDNENDSTDDGENTSGGPTSKAKRMRTSFKHHQVLRNCKNGDNNLFSATHHEELFQPQSQPRHQGFKTIGPKDRTNKESSTSLVSKWQVIFPEYGVSNSVLARAKWRRSQSGREEGESGAFNSYSVCNKSVDIRNNSSLSIGSGIDSQSFGSIEESRSPKSPTESAQIGYTDN